MKPEITNKWEPYKLGTCSNLHMFFQTEIISYLTQFWKMSHLK
jgi:hypothetical protein